MEKARSSFKVSQGFEGWKQEYRGPDYPLLLGLVSQKYADSVISSFSWDLRGLEGGLGYRGILVLSFWGLRLKGPGAKVLLDTCVEFRPCK